MSIYEYDEERHIRQEREDAWEDGRKAGLDEGGQAKLLELIQKKLAKGEKIPEIASDLEEEENVIINLISSLSENS